MTPFAHLHVHSYFSLLDGAGPPRELCRRAAELGMTALAVTDHDTLAGAVRFYQAAQEAGVKPIIGVEFTVELAGEEQLPPLRPPGHADAAVDHQPRPDTTTDYTRRAHLTLLARDNEGYANLCRLVTCARLGKARHAGPFAEEYRDIDRKRPVLAQERLREYAGHLICLSGCEKGEIPRLVAAGRLREAMQVADYYRQIFGAEGFYIEAQNHLLPHPEAGLRYRLGDLAARLDVPLLATNNVHYVDRHYARARDILVCIRALQTVHEWHPDRKTNAEYGLKAGHEMGALFRDQPEAICAAVEIAEQCEWELDLETFHVPDFGTATAGLGNDNGERRPHPPAVERQDEGQDERQGNGNGGLTPRPPLPAGEGEHGNGNGNEDDAMDGEDWGDTPLSVNRTPYTVHRTPPSVHRTPPSALLRRLCYDGARKLYPEITPQVKERIEHELKVIGDQGLCDYFLIVWDICRFARSRGIIATGRGSAGDSIVSYLLDITSVDPLAHDLLFERFLNPERRQLPDIDVDFDSRRRDEVNAYIYGRYGPEQVAAVCTINTFRARSAVREVGKALGMDEREVGRLAETLPHVRASEIKQAAEHLPEVREAGLNLDDKSLLLELCAQISGFPRHLSVHVGGLVIGAEPLTNMLPLALASKGIVICEFDKDDVETLGLVKMDILGLRIHTAISDCVELIERRTGRRIDLDRIPLDDEQTFELLRSTNTIGLFQLESPGQRNLLGRAQPGEFEEVIANISLFRPGPVQSDMIKPYLRRKHGLEPVRYAHPALAPILRRTWGVLIYQEQVLEIAAAVAGFSLGEADKLRRLMTSDRSKDEMLKLGETFIEKAIARGVDPQAAEEVFRMVSGFAAYGFCKAHAACFGKVSYQTAWLKAHYPAEFLAGILSAQPMGFYPPRTIAEEARRLGCSILPPCVNRSEEGFTVEGGDIRVGLRLLRGMSAAGLRSIIEARERDGPFESLQDFCRRTRVPKPVVENLILARAFAFTGRSEQELLWEGDGGIGDWAVGIGQRQGQTAGLTPSERQDERQDEQQVNDRDNVNGGLTPQPPLPAGEGGNGERQGQGGLPFAVDRTPYTVHRTPHNGGLTPQPPLPAGEGGNGERRTAASPPGPLSFTPLRGDAQERGSTENGNAASPPAPLPAGEGGNGERQDQGGLPFAVDHTPYTVHRTPPLDLEPTSPVARVALDLNICHVSTTVNPFSFWRKRMEELGVTPSTGLFECRHGEQVRVAGVVIARARPPTRSGKTAIFITLEDELGLVDVAVFEECYQRCGRALYASPVLCIEGKLTRLGALDLSVTAQQVIGLGNWDEFARAEGHPAGTASPPRLKPQQGNEMRRVDNRLMDRWEPQVNPKVGERRG